MRSALAVFLSLFATLCAPALAAGLEYRVEIEAPEELAAVLRKGLNLVRWQSDPQMTPEQLRRLADEAVRDAKQTAATEGYFSARVEVVVDEKAQPWQVLLRVEPGERTLVSDVDIRLSGPAERDGRAQRALERVRDAWPLRPGQPFRQADWDAAKRQAVRELARWRYAAAQVGDSQARIDPQKRRASLKLEIASGPLFRFGPVRVSGTRRYPEALVENLNPVDVGEDYDRDKVVVYQRRLLETGYFASVQVDIDAQPEVAAAAPLRVAVIEAPTHYFETGVSYNTDAGPRLEMRYSHQDLLGSAWRFRSGLRLDQKVQDLQLDLDSPPERDARWNNLFMRARQGDIQNETTRALSFGVGHNHGTDLSPSVVILSAHFEEQRVLASLIDNRHAVYLGYRRHLRKTDDVVAPRSGYFGSVEIGGAPAALATEEFLRIVGNASLLVPVARNGDLVLRAQAGAVLADTRQGIPTTFLFRTGGDQTVRGYAFESLGVRQGDAIVGGRSLFVGSAEYTHWLGESWGLAGFIDAGDAWDSGLRFEPAVGYGLGVRFRTPIGPVRADLAYGRRTEAWRLHLSMGYTF